MHQNQAPAIQPVLQKDVENECEDGEQVISFKLNRTEQLSLHLILSKFDLIKTSHDNQLVVVRQQQRKKN
jgi:hypothetical protein